MSHSLSLNPGAPTAPINPVQHDAAKAVLAHSPQNDSADAQAPAAVPPASSGQHATAAHSTEPAVRVRGLTRHFGERAW